MPIAERKTGRKSEAESETEHKAKNDTARKKAEIAAENDKKPGSERAG